MMERRVHKIWMIFSVLMLVAAGTIVVENGTVKVQAATYSTKQERNDALKEQLKSRIHQSSDEIWYYIYRSEADFFLQARQGIEDDSEVEGEEVVIPDELEDDSVVIVGCKRNAVVTDSIFSRYSEDGKTKSRLSIPSEINGYKVTGLGNPLQDTYLNPKYYEVDETCFGLNNFSAFDLVVVPSGVDIIYDYCF